MSNPYDTEQAVATSIAMAPFIDKLIACRATPAIVIGIAQQGGDRHPVIAYDQNGLSKAQLADTLRRLAAEIEKGNAAAHN
jgi:hypothetical protein